MRSRFFNLYLVIMIIGGNRSMSSDVLKWAFGLRSLFKNCLSISWINSDGVNSFKNFQKCLQHRALNIIDTYLNENVISLHDGIELIKFENKVLSSANQESNRINDARSIEASNLWEIFKERITRLFQTHAFKFDLKYLKNLFGSQISPNNALEGRGRRKRRHEMMLMMIMGLVLMGSVLIPMGFQFLAVLGGKALILAKMALMLSSIQGLKKVATSGVNYGLYHSPVPEPWHERNIESIPPMFDIPYNHYVPFERRHQILS